MTGPAGKAGPPAAGPTVGGVSGEPTPTDPRVLRSRARVLAATVALLQERGIAGTTIEAVAAHSKVAKTTIYRQWPDQAALVLAAFDSALSGPPDDPDTGTLRGDLLALALGLARSLSEGPAARLLPAILDAASRDATFAELHRREAARRHRGILAVIARGVARGELPADTDPRNVLDLVAGPLFHRSWMSGGTLDATFAERVVATALAGFGPVRRNLSGGAPPGSPP